MEKKITLEEVLTFSEQFGFEKQGVGFVGILFMFVAIFLIIGAIVSLFADGSSAGLGLVFFGAPAAVIFIFLNHSAENVKSEQYHLYKDKEREWQIQYAAPYVESLPVESITEIENVSYSSEFKSKSESKKFKDPSYKIPENTVPIKVTKNSGEIIEVWATVKPLGEKEVETLEYKYIPKDLLFHEISGVPLYREGYYEVVLYTDKKI